MNKHYKVVFTQLSEQTTLEHATQALQSKLKLSEQHAHAFLKGTPVFAAQNQENAQKQMQALARLGIQSQLQAVEKKPAPHIESAPSHGPRDEQILTALDYITSSLIRLEERLDDIEQRLSSPSHTVQNSDSTDALDLELDIALNDPHDDAPSSHKSRTLMLLILLLIIVLALAAGRFFYPDFLSF